MLKYATILAALVAFGVAAPAQAAPAGTDLNDCRRGSCSP